MGFPVRCNWLSALLCLLLMGGEVLCDCTQQNMQTEGGTSNLAKERKGCTWLVNSCPEGYYPYPAMTHHCPSNDSRTAAHKNLSQHTCARVECPDPNVLEYGNVSPPQGNYFVGNETTYECYSGYTLRGSSRRICLPNGKWSGSTPICSRDTGDHCADPGIPAGATRTGNSFGIDDKVRYSCRGNLFLMGSRERTCLENGHWSGTEPACYYKHTFDTHQEIAQAFGRKIVDLLTLSEPVYEPRREERKITISKTGTLNIYMAVDISEDIPLEDIENAKDAIKKLIIKISSFAVNPNYEIVFFTCNIYEVANIIDYRSGNSGLQTIMQQLENFQVNKTTADYNSDLNLVLTTFLERMALIKQMGGKAAFRDERHVVIIFTNDVYYTCDPAPTVTKIKNLVYMSSEDDQGAQPREEYLDIYIFATGYEIFENLMHLTVGTGGQHYFRLKSIENLDQAFDQMIDEEEVIGMCGLHKTYETHDRNSDREMYPWMANIYVRTSVGRRHCSGSLVTPRFVLTAAHCFTFEILPEDVTVNINDGKSSEKRVKRFWIHPRFNLHARAAMGVSEFYDYDVALIQLMEDVVISTAVRPICIPCTQETSNALKLVSTCREQEQFLLKTHLERLSFLTRTRSGSAEKEVHAKLGDNRDECIRHALDAQGITATDPKVAVTDNFLCTGGRIPIRDHIACLGDAGGAVFKNYEHRTIQVALVSWGTKILCTAGGLVESDGTSRDFHINLFSVVPFLKSILGNDTQDDYAPLKFLDS